MTHAQADQPISGRHRDQILTPEQSYGVGQHGGWASLEPPEAQPSREQLVQRWSGELRSASDPQPLPKLFF